ncbi:MAG: transcriptional activator RfaH [Magnetospirillum sp.]|nr:transcriptional activator RfaH [Magnetospirillum sp.]
MNGDTTIRWYVVHTRPNGEETAARNLERQGFSVYLPRCRRRISHARKQQTVLRPFFPRYLFVALDLDAERWQAIHSTFGVTAMVTDGERPLPVPAGVVEEIRAGEDEVGMVVLPPTPSFAVGDRVQVVDGPLRDSWGRFGGLGDNERVYVLLRLMGREMRVALPREAVAG